MNSCASRCRGIFALCLATLALAACDTSSGGSADGDGPVDAATATDGALAWEPFCRGARPDVQVCRRNLVIAHRGGGRLAPEETLEAFNAARMIGADVLETDVRSTSDGVLVLMHDETVDRTTDGTGAIHAKTWAEVEALDAGYRYTSDGGKTFPFRGKGVRVSRLDQVLAALPDASFSVEIKQSSPPIVEEVVRIIGAAPNPARVLIASFDDNVIVDVRAKRPGGLTSFALGETTRFVAATVDTPWTPPCPVLQAPLALAEADRLETAHHFGVRMHVWTINDRPTMERLFRLGVDGIMSDDPALLFEVRRSLGLKPE